MIELSCGRHSARWLPHRDGSSLGDALGFCDAAGCDLAEIADAMLADAATSLPGIEGDADMGLDGAFEQEPAGSPFADGHTDGLTVVQR